MAFASVCKSTTKVPAKHGTTTSINTSVAARSTPCVECHFPLHQSVPITLEYDLLCICLSPTSQSLNETSRLPLLLMRRDASDPGRYLAAVVFLDLYPLAELDSRSLRPIFRRIGSVHLQSPGAGASESLACSLISKCYGDLKAIKLEWLWLAQSCPLAHLWASHPIYSSITVHRD